MLSTREYVAFLVGSAILGAAISGGMALIVGASWKVALGGFILLTMFFYAMTVRREQGKLNR